MFFVELWWHSANRVVLMHFNTIETNKLVSRSWIEALIEAWIEALIEALIVHGEALIEALIVHDEALTLHRHFWQSSFYSNFIIT